MLSFPLSLPQLQYQFVNEKHSEWQIGGSQMDMLNQTASFLGTCSDNVPGLRLDHVVS
jgi:hypothetical protein